MKVLIVGAGVIGTVYGAQLEAAGATLTVARDFAADIEALYRRAPGR
jgi:ketopantoate reductase